MASVVCVPIRSPPGIVVVDDMRIVIVVSLSVCSVTDHSVKRGVHGLTWRPLAPETVVN